MTLDADNDIDLTRGVYRRIYSGATRGRRINSVSMLAELLFWRLHLVADDFGAFEADPRLILCTAIPLRRDITESQIAEALAELAQAPLVELYEVRGEPYGRIIDFEAMQPANKNGRRIRRHPPPGESGGIQVNPGDAGKSCAAESESESESNQQAALVSAEPPQAAALAAPANPLGDQRGQSSSEQRHRPKADDSPIVLTFPTEGKAREWHLRQSKLTEYRETYPNLDVMAEIRQSRQWLIDNPTRRKTPGGMPAFLTRWLKRAQNYGGSRNGKPLHRKPTAAERGEFEEPVHSIPILCGASGQAAG